MLDIGAGAPHSLTLHHQYLHNFENMKLRKVNNQETMHYFEITYDRDHVEAKVNYIDVRN